MQTIDLTTVEDDSRPLSPHDTKATAIVINSSFDDDDDDDDPSKKMPALTNMARVSMSPLSSHVSEGGASTTNDISMTSLFGLQRARKSIPAVFMHRFSWIIDSFISMYIVLISYHSDNDVHVPDNDVHVPNNDGHRFCCIPRRLQGNYTWHSFEAWSKWQNWYHQIRTQRAWSTDGLHLCI